MTEIPAGLPLRGRESLAKGRDPARSPLFNKDVDHGSQSPRPPAPCLQGKEESKVLPGHQDTGVVEEPQQYFRNPRSTKLLLLETEKRSQLFVILAEAGHNKTN